MEAELREYVSGEKIAPFSKTYDTRDPAQCERAHQDLANWGRLHTTRHVDPERELLTLTFRPAPDRRWSKWEEVRKRKILSK
jgi:hypothetical protein